MSQALTLARPYARAAFGIARDAGRLPVWSNLLAFSAAAVSDEQVKNLLGHPKLEAEALVDLISPQGDIDPTFRSFLLLLAENRRLALLPEMLALYEQLRAEAERVVHARVTAAAALDAASLDAIKSALAKRFGQDVQVEVAIDPDLIGGAVIDAGDVVIDGSLRGKLKRLETALAQ
jgi:F-type H+-transporting ATPase subunit delta